MQGKISRKAENATEVSGNRRLWVKQHKFVNSWLGLALTTVKELNIGVQRVCLAGQIDVRSSSAFGRRGG